MKIACLMLVAMLAFGSVAEGSPQGFWDRLGGSIRNRWNSAKDTARDGYNFARGAVQGTGDMYRAYSDMRKANWRNSDRYFHARGNYDAAQRGPGGAWASRVISNAREWTDQLRGGSAAASARDQEANRWGRNGGDPNRYRPAGLPNGY